MFEPRRVKVAVVLFSTHGEGSLPSKSWRKEVNRREALAHPSSEGLSRVIRYASLGTESEPMWSLCSTSKKPGHALAVGVGTTLPPPPGVAAPTRASENETWPSLPRWKATARVFTFHGRRSLPS